jgi:hypothetical protein
MVNLQDVFMLDANSRIDAECMARIWQSGRSRIPVCDRERTNIIGTYPPIPPPPFFFFAYFVFGFFLPFFHFFRFFSRCFFFFFFPPVFRFPGRGSFILFYGVIITKLKNFTKNKM